MPKLEAPTGAAEAVCAALEMTPPRQSDPANIFLYYNEKELSMSDQPTLVTSTDTFQKVDPVADIKAAQEASTSKTTAQHVKDAMLIAQLGAYASAAEAQVPEEGQLPSVTLHDANFASNMRRAVDLLTDRGFGLPWTAQWDGSVPAHSGWTIFVGTEALAFLSGDESMGGAVTALVDAHNKALGYVG